MGLIGRLRATHRAFKEIKRRAYVLRDLGFRPTLNENCPLQPDGWRPGEVYARGDERVCVRCLAGWSASHRVAHGEFTVESGLNILSYEPRTMEEIGTLLYPHPQGFTLVPPGQIIPL